MERDCELKSDFLLEMYALPSQTSPISNRTVERYFYRHNQNDLIFKAATLEKHKDVGIPKNKVEEIRQVEESKKKAFIEGLLKNNDIKIRKDAVEMIWYMVEKTEQKLLIEEALKNDNVEVRRRAVWMIEYAKESDRTLLIEKALDDDDEEVQKITTAMIEHAKESDKKSLVEKALKSSYMGVKKEVAEMIEYLQESDKSVLREKIREIIEEVFLSDDIKAKKEGAEMIQYLQEFNQHNLREKVKEIIKEALLGDSVENQKEAMEIIKYVEESEKKLLMEIVISKGLSNFFVESPLYKNRVISEVGFERQSFEKTGSDLTLIGGKLKGKSIIRTIKPTAFLAWQKTYENYEGWKKAGFDYVPIEPIQSYFFDEKKKLVNVFSGVLDLSLGSWNKKSSLFRDELTQQKEKIISVLNSQGVKHGHLEVHDDNFVLCFFRNQNGSIDFNKIPRLYAIDFDAATLSLSND